MYRRQNPNPKCRPPVISVLPSLLKALDYNNGESRSLFEHMKLAVG